MRFGKLAIVLGVGVLLCAPALAQQPRTGGFGGFGGGLASQLGTNKQLQEELKLEKDQIEKLTEALTKVREDLKDDLAKLRDRNTAQEDRTAITKKLGEANNKAIGAILKAEQSKRLHQIENQQAGLGMFTKEDVQKTLKLSDEQKDEISTINKDLQKDTRELFSGGGRNAFDAETMKKRTALQKEAMEKVQKLLKDDQKTLVKDLTGEPFELRLGTGVPGGAGGFGGFGGGGTPGKLLSTGAQETLKLTDDQKKQLEAIQKEADEKLSKLLNDDQKKQLKDMQERGTRGGRPGGNRPGNPNPPQ